MLAKRFARKKTKLGYSVLRKPKFKAKNNHLEKSHNAVNCQRGDVFRKFNLLQNIKKRRGPLGDLKKFWFKQGIEPASTKPLGRSYKLVSNSL